MGVISWVVNLDPTETYVFLQSKAMSDDAHSCRLLFVYGTLRRQSQQGMARYLERYGRFVGAAQTAGRLYDLGTFPGLLPPESADDWVKGDLFELHGVAAALPVLDRYEGCDRGLYQRGLAPVQRHNGQTVAAWVYWYQGDVQPQQRILAGDYFTR